MTELRMTPKRLELLQAIADGKVLRNELSAERATYWDGRQVTMRVHDLIRAGFVELGDRHGRWRELLVTPSGESVLASHREGS